MTIKTKGSQDFSIPNTYEGKEFINLLKKFTNRKRWNIKVRGRGSRKEHGDQSDIPLDYAEWFAVYLSRK